MGQPRYRDFFITINLGAECYENALNILLDLDYRLYAYIVHNKDFQIFENDGVIEEKLKTEHIHIVLELKNAKTFTSMQDKFKGAHIETIKYKKASYQYLIHNSPNSKEKYQYDIKEIKTNNFEAVKLSIELEDGLRLFKETEFMHYIAEGINNKYTFVKAFGLNVYKQYWSVYADMLKLSKEDTDMILDLAKIKEDMENELPF